MSNKAQLPKPDSILIYNLQMEPEYRLMHAILWRALKDIFGKCPIEKKEALNFVFDKSKRKWGFLWLCEHIDLNPLSVKKHLREYRDKLHLSPLAEMLYLQ